MVTRREEEWEVALQGGKREFDGGVIFGGFDVSVKKKKDVWLTNYQQRVAETVLATVERRADTHLLRRKRTSRLS